MAVKLGGTLSPMGNYEVAKGENISVSINGVKKMLQTAIDNGDFASSSGSGSTGGGSNVVIGSNSEYYSSEEADTHKVWYDNKGIYRKVFQFTETIAITAPVTEFTVCDGSSWNFVGSFHVFDYESERHVNGLRYNDGNGNYIYTEVVKKSDGSIVLRICASASKYGNITGLYVSVEYTKNEDNGRLMGYVGTCYDYVADEPEDWEIMNTQEFWTDILANAEYKVECDGRDGFVNHIYELNIPEGKMGFIACPNEWQWDLYLSDGVSTEGINGVNSINTIMSMGNFDFVLPNGNEVYFNVNTFCEDSTDYNWKALTGHIYLLIKESL